MSIIFTKVYSVLKASKCRYDTYETLCDTLDERFNFTSINFAKLRAVKREDELNYCESC